MRLAVLAVVLPVLVCAADVCNPRNFQGTYAFQLSGETRISGQPKPAASIGRLVFDGTGSVSGYSSTQFAGYLQGNPTTGSYEARTDCSIAWSLQDTSGAYQHFGGKMTPDFKRVQFRQTDPGGPQNGLMLRTPDTCSAATLQRQYQFSIRGGYIPMEPGQEGHTVSASGIAQVADSGQLVLGFAGQPEPKEGSVSVESDCAVTMTLHLSADETVNLRGHLVDGGKEILAIGTDPGATVTARFNQ